MRQLMSRPLTWMLPQRSGSGCWLRLMKLRSSCRSCSSGWGRPRTRVLLC